MSGNQPSNPYGPPEPGQGSASGYGQGSESWTPSSSNPPSSTPQYGQRSENWTPQNPDQPQNTEPQTPWPVYGQNGQGQVPNSSGVPQQPYGQPQYGSPSPYPSAPYQGQYAPPSGSMPSRTAPILTLIAGLVMMFAIAPIVFFSTALGGIGLDKMVDGSIQSSNGGTVVVNSTGIIAVMPISGQASACSVSDSSGATTQLFYETESGGMYVGRQLAEGTYTIQCEGIPTGSELMVMDGEFMSSLVSSSVKALGWASLIGVAGLVTTIVGIGWLVKRNGQRRAYMQNRQY